ncbi:MAG TPA: 2-oxo acid dehydrogenase subunit E2 [Verrucomicrobiales bacterium]|nr:2-oxo acid dehydrogenase subunit E2 [Verrucomicrobiales bacterium]
MPEVPIRMPQLGESIAEAVILEVLVQPEESVEAGQEIFEVETDKAVMTVTTPCAGRIARITAEPEVSYAVGAVLGYLEATEEEAAKSGISQPPVDSAPAADSMTAPTRQAPVKAPEPPAQPKVKPTVEGLPVPAKATGASYLSPRMKARMLELGLNAADLAGVAGSGSGGRVTIEDFEIFIAELEKNPSTAASPMRIAVADSMRRSWSRPLATVGIPVQLDALLAHRRTAQERPGPALYAIRAMALALSENIALAGRLIGSQIVHPIAVDIGFAVEVDDGVLVPVIREVDRKPLPQLVPVYNRLVQQARNRRLPHDAIGSGIATVTNYGTFGIVWATPIPLPEQNLVLGLGAGVKAPLWNEDKQKFFPVTQGHLTLSFDHRILDGGAAGRLLNQIANLLQKPGDL